MEHGRLLGRAALGAMLSAVGCTPGSGGGEPVVPIPTAAPAASSASVDIEPRRMRGDKPARIAAKDCCKGRNECKGRGNCKTDLNDCKGKNECKGKGGCKGGDCVESDRNCCKGQNDCKGKGGCKTAANACKGMNACKGQGGCKSMDCGR